MSHKFLPWQASKSGFSHDSTALEILNNYSNVHLKEDPRIHKSKSTGRPSMNWTYEHGGILVYDVKAVNSLHTPPPDASPEPFSFPIQEINESNLGTYLQFKKFAPCPDFSPEYSLKVPEDESTLIFDSKFESGNLKKAIKMNDNQYQLVISSDINTHGQNHWYYFSVQNPRKTAVTFTIVNMLKFDDLYKAGLQPAVYSTLHFDRTGIKWHRDGSNISYEPNFDFQPGRKFFSLSFTYDFRYTNDKVFFAYSIPYSYEDLSRYLHFIKEKHPKIARVSPLCKTIAGNLCEMITITENIRSYMSHEEEVHQWGISSSARKMLRNKKARKAMHAKILGKETEDEHIGKLGIVLTARVHSGETVSSYMIQGAIDFLLGESRQARVLRKKFVFKVVPMLNPDGVRYGNYRCSLIGVDLNRRWEKPNRYLHPTVFYTKKMIEVFAENHKVLMSCDMHGHSKKRNVFMYGCAIKSMDCLTVRKNLMAKVVPLALSQRSKFFTFGDCHFRIEKSKSSTARIVIYNEFDIPHSYTMEASFFGPLNKKVEIEGYHMTEKDLRSIGEDLCKTCMMFTSKTAYFSKIRKTNDYLRRLMYRKKEEKSAEKPIEAENEAPSPEENEELPEALEEVKTNIECEVGESHVKKSSITKLEDEKMWDGIEVVNYSESDEEGSGGSDSCPSEKLEEPIVKKTLKRKAKKDRKKNKEMLEIDCKPEQSGIEIIHEDKQERLKKTYSLRPKFRVAASRKSQSKEEVMKNPPAQNLRSQNIMFNCPLPATMQIINEKLSDIVNKSQREIPRKKSTFLRAPEAAEELITQPFSTVVKGPVNLNYSFERNIYRKPERDVFASFNGSNVLSDYSWTSGRPSYIAKNFADSARYRIEKMYSKFAI